MKIIYIQNFKQVNFEVYLVTYKKKIQLLNLLVYYRERERQVKIRGENWLERERVTEKGKIQS